jgi:methanol--5-hydroxybenzimidazolylcobamide Co-methyltransferase
MAKKTFTEAAYQNVNDLVYGTAKYPVTTRSGLVIGGGTLYPEVNFTLPTMLITDESMPEILTIYKEILTGICQRAVDLQVPGYVAEFEWLPAMSFEPERGIEITKVLVDVARDFEQKYGLKGAVRSTPVDIREGKDVKNMWNGPAWDKVVRSIEGSAEVGADFLSIESIGGKDVHDDAIMYSDIEKSIYGLGVLGCKDMSKLWAMINGVADKSDHTFAAGDTACGFANTAMVLAETNYISKVFAAVVRAIAIVRSLVAFEEGAVGPDKDCGYEGVFIKAITGSPISMEGRVAAVAHLSSVGNIAICAADLWSNESVQHLKLLAGYTEVISLEQLAYDCRLMNLAKQRGPETALLLRDLNADSDSAFDPQAFILRPESAIEIAKGIVSEKNNHYLRAKKAAAVTLDVIRKGYDAKKLILNDRELLYLDQLSEQIAALETDEGAFIERLTKASKSSKFDPAVYEL